jgi:hypothetical protein
MDWKRISGLWSEFQVRAKARGKGLPTAQDERASTLRELWTTRPGPGIQDPLVRQMDYRQRMALLKREIEEIEREVTRFRAMVQEDNDPSTNGQERRTNHHNGSGLSN